jgi:hypothetical protein
MVSTWRWAPGAGYWGKPSGYQVEISNLTWCYVYTNVYYIYVSFFNVQQQRF